MGMSAVSIGLAGFGIALKFLGSVGKEGALVILAIGAAFALFGLGMMAAGKGIQYMTTGFA